MLAKSYRDNNVLQIIILSLHLPNEVQMTAERKKIVRKMFEGRDAMKMGHEDLDGGRPPYFMRLLISLSSCFDLLFRSFHF